ncbi:MAG: hypothetical protein QY323_01490 [Patescibacteria group bacterium]|nr:MAG: hypothetical protein QY323_01490 [Patescibacteria group bacterium]
MPAKKTYTPSRAQKKPLTKSKIQRELKGWWNHEGRKMSSAQLCDRCDAVWYDGHWHTAPGLAAMLRAKKKAAKGAKKTMLCHECHVAVHGPRDPKQARYEGQLILDGLDDVKEKAEILATIRNFAKRQLRRDPEDRVVAIDDRGARVVVTTTVNQTAVSMGKAVAASHKGGDLKISWSKTDLPARVRWIRKPRKEKA